MKLFSTLFSFVLLLVAGAGQGRAQTPPDALFSAFQKPGPDAKPFLYWWWLGNDATREEIVRQLDLMHKAGVAGVHIVPIGDATGRLEWLSPEWWRLIKFAADQAKVRNMAVDLSASYGWPSGGPFVRPQHRLQAISCVTEELSGPAKYDKKVIASLSEKLIGDRRVAFVRLVPKQFDRLNQVMDLTNQVRDGQLSFDIPDGQHILYIGIHRVGIRQNKQSGLKDDYALDYFDRKGVRAYLEHFAETSRNALSGARLGDFLHAFFVSSVEIYPANWTTGFAEEFQRRRGYDLMPYLQFATGMYPIMGHRESLKPRPDLFTPSADVADSLRRVRYDYNLTLVELFSENFVQQVQQWCRDQGTLFRYQAYGFPWNIGMGENYMIPDIPEGNNWIHSVNPEHGWEVWNKYAAAGGHLTGKRLISNEAMTTQAGMFHETLDLVKRADDFNFITGNTRSVVHGFCYSPASVPSPGQSKYGLFVSEHNPWWPYFPRWTEYNARISQLFQLANPVLDVAILCPTADVWSDSGLNRNAQQGTPRYGYKLWEALSQQGLSADYLHEAIIQKADFSGGQLSYGPMHYKLLVLCDVQTLEPATADAILSYVRAGGRLAIIGRQPSRSPSLSDAVIRDERVSTALQTALAKLESSAGERRVIHLTPPGAAVDLLAWTSALIEQTQIPRRVTFTPVSPSLFQVQYRVGERDIFFLSNQNSENRVACEADFGLKAKVAWCWNPETATRTIYPATESGRLAIDLAPSESLLLVFEPAALQGQPYTPPLVAGDVVQAIAGPWNLKLRSFRGEDTEFRGQKLAEFSNDPKLNRFAGVVEYETTFDVLPEQQKAAAVLDLGKVNGVTEVWVNGRSLNARWYGAHHYPLAGTMQPGQNRLRVKVSTLLANGVGEPQSPRESTGMPGPVVVRKARPR